ncbi:unnamed protein product, partial [Mesorhabditis spiculigera]
MYATEDANGKDTYYPMALVSGAAVLTMFFSALGLMTFCIQAIYKALKTAENFGAKTKRMQRDLFRALMIQARLVARPRHRRENE